MVVWTVKVYTLNNALAKELFKLWILLEKQSKRFRFLPIILTVVPACSLESAER
jgi:hypothetical protein